MKNPFAAGSILTKAVFAIVLPCSLTVLSADVVQTKDGSVINGKILSVEAGVIEIETGYAGKIKIKQDQVLSFSSDETINVETQGGNTFVGTVEGNDGNIKIAADGGTFETSVENVSAVWQQGQVSPTARDLQRKWQFEAAVDISGKSGNSDRTSTGIGARAVLESKEDKLGFYISVDKAEENGNTTADEIKGGVDYSAFLSETISWYARGELEKDEIELLDLRTTAAVGVGKHVLRRDDHKLEFRGGLAYRFENFQDGSKVESPGLDLGLIHFMDLGWGSLNNLLTYNPSFEDFGNFRVYHESSLDLPVGTGEFWKLRLGVSNDYNSEPIAGLDELDTTYYLRLLLSWR